MVGNNIYFGIEDLAANAFIHLLSNGDETLEITLKSLEKYGDNIVKYLNEHKNVKAYGIYSRQLSNRMYDIYDDLFEEGTLSGDRSVKLINGVTEEKLTSMFRGYIKLELLDAFTNVKYVA